MPESALDKYKRHIDRHGEDAVLDTAENDRSMTEDDVEALRKYIRGSRKKARDEHKREVASKARKAGVK